MIYRRKAQAAAAAATGGSAELPTASESAADRIRVAIDKISEQQANSAAASLSLREPGRAGVYQCADQCFETQIVGVSGRVSRMLATTSGTVWVACGNGQVDVFAADTHARLSTVRARSSAISQLQQCGQYVWLASTDGGVSVYSLAGMLEDTLAAHGAKVTGIAAVEQTVWTCGADMTIRVWEYQRPFTCIKELELQSFMMSMIYHLGVVWVGTESVIVRAARPRCR